jgi:hypothetical protein
VLAIQILDSGDAAARTAERGQPVRVLGGAEQGVVVDLLGVGPGRTWSPMMIVGIGLTVPPAFSPKVTTNQLLW